MSGNTQPLRGLAVLAAGSLLMLIAACSGSATTDASSSPNQSTSTHVELDAPQSQIEDQPSATTPKPEATAAPEQTVGASDCVEVDSGSITTFEVPGSTKTMARAINNSGDIAGYYEDRFRRYHGFVRAADGTIRTIDVPGATQTIILDMNEAGDVVGHYFERDTHPLSEPVGEHGFVQLADGTITTIDITDSIGLVLYAINDAGEIAGYTADENLDRTGFLRSESGTITTIDLPDALSTSVLGLTNRTQVVGHYDKDSERSDLPIAVKSRHGFVWAPNAETIVFDAPPDSGRIQPNDLNETGSIAGDYQARGDGRIRRHGFIRDPQGEWSTIDAPGSTDTYIWAINDEGSVAGTFVDADNVQHGFTRSGDGAFITIEVPGSSRTVASLIAHNGNAAGHYRPNDTEEEQAFIWTPKPCG